MAAARGRAAAAGEGARAPSPSDRLQKLDPVAERIGHIRPLITGERLVDGEETPELFAALRQRGQVIDEERRMRLLCRAEVLLNAEVHVGGAGAEPQTAAAGEVGGLRDFFESEDADV